ncbi:MAG: tetratricopeptide repeat protein [Hyphomicrobium sp.]
MNRKIAAILAADIAGYSRLVSEDEEEAVRRLASYRAVFDDFIKRFNGRIFNTAGDAVLAEFPSAVDAVRCAVDVQESLRARNLAYPSSRQMNFRIGITIGDVVERDGDLLGDGVNIAARLETLATPGGICISRSVHEAVANKLSVSFADRGHQQLKNMPERVHAYSVVLEERKQSQVSVATRAKGIVGGNKMRKVGLAAGAAVAILAGVGGAHYLSNRKSADTPEPTAKTEPAKKETVKPAEAAAEPAVRPTEQAATSKAVETPREGTIKPATSSDGESTPAASPEAETETAEKTSDQPQGDVSGSETRLKPSDLTAKVVLQRNWNDCHSGTPAQVLVACPPIIEGRMVGGNDMADIQLRYGKALRDDSQVDKAIIAYSEAINLKPTVAAYIGRGIAYYDKGDWQRSIADYSEAILIDKNNGEAFNNRAWTRYQSGDVNGALPDANTAVRLMPGKAYVWDTRGHIYESLGDKTAALRDFRKALSISSSLDTSKKGVERLQ